MANKTLGQKGLNLIMKFEGCRLTAYKCSAGVNTIGYGHTSGVKSGMVITQGQAEEYLRQDCQKFVNYVNDKKYVPQTDSLNQNQFDALVSFAFNCGQGNLKKLCAGNRTLQQISDAMRQYNRAAGMVITGLVRRRNAEIELFNTPVLKAATRNRFETKTWYKVKKPIPVRNGYYGDVGNYDYLSDALKTACDRKNGKGYLKEGSIIYPVEVKTFNDGSVWFKLDPTITCMVVATDGTCYVGKA